MTNRRFRMTLWGRAYNRRLLLVEDYDADADAWNPVDFTGWTSFVSELREQVNGPLLATASVSVSLVDEDGAAVDPSAGYLLWELSELESQKLDDTAVERGVTDIFGVDAGGKLEHVARGTWRQVLAASEVT